MQSVKVSEIMTKQVHTVDVNTSLVEAARKMYENRIGCLVVVSEGRCVGIITERDFVRLFSKRTPYEFKVGDFMTSPPITVRGDSSLNEAKNIMETHRIRHIPVLDSQGNLVGLVSMRDIIERIETLI
ncbi:MAG: CBS domain-containing protein [Nitrososphaerota archaeon]